MAEKRNIIGPLKFQYDSDWNAGSIHSPRGEVAAICRGPDCEALGKMFAAAPAMIAALAEAKREMWLIARHQWTLADFKNWAVIQQIDAALNAARLNGEAA